MFYSESQGTINATTRPNSQIEFIPGGMVQRKIEFVRCVAPKIVGKIKVCDNSLLKADVIRTLIAFLVFTSYILNLLK